MERASPNNRVFRQLAVMKDAITVPSDIISEPIFFIFLDLAYAKDHTVAILLDYFKSEIHNRALIILQVTEKSAGILFVIELLT